MKKKNIRHVYIARNGKGIVVLLLILCCINQAGAIYTSTDEIVVDVLAGPNGDTPGKFTINPSTFGFDWTAAFADPGNLHSWYMPFAVDIAAENDPQNILALVYLRIW